MLGHTSFIVILMLINPYFHRLLMSEITGFTTYFHTSINTVIPLLVLTAIGGGNSRFDVAK